MATAGGRGGAQTRGGHLSRAKKNFPVLVETKKRGNRFYKLKQSKGLAGSWEASAETGRGRTPSVSPLRTPLLSTIRHFFFTLSTHSFDADETERMSATERARVVVSVETDRTDDFVGPADGRGGGQGEPDVVLLVVVAVVGFEGELLRRVVVERRDTGPAGGVKRFTLETN
jgi:hypothetical protein